MWVLARLNFSHVQAVGYANLRCVWVLGCPDEIHPARDALLAAAKSPKEPVATKDIFEQALKELLPGLDVPEVVGVTCCAQFAVSRDAIRRRPREDYIAFRDWLIQTPLTDDLSGRVLEYAWHSSYSHFFWSYFASFTVPAVPIFFSSALWWLTDGTQSSSERQQYIVLSQGTATAISMGSAI